MRQFILLGILLLVTSIASAQSDSTSTTCTDFADAPPPRLIVGEYARVTPGTPLNLRPVPATDQARLAQISPGTTFAITAGPRCNEGYVWWQAEINGQTGWMAEGILTDNGSETEYWLEPRGDLISVTADDGVTRRYVRLDDGFIEPADCLRPPDDYTRQQLGFATLNNRTLAMLDQAQRIYDERNPASLVNFRQFITQGSYNAGGVTASFGTHDAGGAVDLSVRSPLDFSVLIDEIEPMIEALRIAGFAAWLRDTGSLYAESPIHLHTIAVGDAELSDAARLQIDGDRGYLRGFNGLPADYGAPQPLPDGHGGPVICAWMRADGWTDQRADPPADYYERAGDRLASGQAGFALIEINAALDRAGDTIPPDYLLLRAQAFDMAAEADLAIADYAAYIDIAGENADPTAITRLDALRGEGGSDAG